MSDSLAKFTAASISRARAEQGAALGDLLEHYRNYLWLIARTQISQHLTMRTSPSDLVQETFLQAAREFHQFQGADLPQLMAWGQTHQILSPALPLATLQRQAALAEAHMALCRAHTLTPVHAPLSIWWARHSLQAEQQRPDWSSYTLGAVHTAIAEGNHFSMLQPPHVQSLAQDLRASLHTAQFAEVAASTDE